MAEARLAALGEEHLPALTELLNEPDTRAALRLAPTALADWRAAYAGWAADRDEENYAILAGEAFAGWLKINGLAGEAWISMLVIGEKWRRRGLGGRALALAEANLARRGYRRLRLHVDRDNGAARSCYQKSGYALTEEREGVCTCEKSLARKNLFFIGGTMGIGKTTACQILKEQLPRAAFLDGDWCWDMSPFTVNEETKALVTDNICQMLNGFLRCQSFDNVIFCWVMHEQAIIDGLLARLDLRGARLINVSLVCSEDALAQRLRRDIAAGRRAEDVLARSLPRLPLYRALNTVKLDVSDLDAAAVAGELRALLEDPFPGEGNGRG